MAITPDRQLDNIPLKATEPSVLEERIMNPNTPKNEQEWWAKEKINVLTAERDAALKRVEELDKQNKELVQEAVRQSTRVAELELKISKDKDVWCYKCGDVSALKERVIELEDVIEAIKEMK